MKGGMRPTEHAQLRGGIEEPMCVQIEKELSGRLEKRW